MMEEILTPEQRGQIRELLEPLKKRLNLRQYVETDTKFGRVRGILKEGVLQWHSIPYTASTAGENRWRAPKDPEKWTGILDVTEPRDPVIQRGNDGTASGVEDQLTLDIYRPDTMKTEMPVMVYVHGGNNQTGDSNEISGASFVSRHDAVFVSIDYRLNTLGFNPLPALKHGTPEENSGNFAILDIAKALDWVHDNIANFGGDPDNITLSGFSGGARDVTAALIASPLRGKFHRAVSFSGGMTTADPEKSEQVFARALAPLAVEDGMAEDEAAAAAWLLQDIPAVRDYLYALPADRVVNAIGVAGIRMEIFPHLYRDGVVLPKDGFDAQDYYDVPCICYTGANEFTLFALMDPYFLPKIQAGTYAKEKELRKQYAFLKEIGSKFYSLLNCQESAEAIAARNRSKVYGIQLDFGRDPKTVDLPFAALGPYHGAHQALMDPENSQAAPMIGNAFNKQGPREMRLIFQEYIYNFMKTGDPNGEGLPEWKAWGDGADGNILHLDANDDQPVITNVPKEYDYEDVMEEIRAYDAIPEDIKLYFVKNVLNGRWFSRRLDAAYDNLSEFEKQQ